MNADRIADCRVQCGLEGEDVRSRCAPGPYPRPVAKTRIFLGPGESCADFPDPEERFSTCAVLGSSHPLDERLYRGVTECTETKGPQRRRRGREAGWGTIELRNLRWQLDGHETPKEIVPEMQARQSVS